MKSVFFKFGLASLLVGLSSAGTIDTTGSTLSCNGIGG